MTTAELARGLSPQLIERFIHQAAHLLPAQGPITVFVHHNTLHAFEELRFQQAVLQGAHVFGCHPYLSEDEYRQELAAGRIGTEDLRAALLEDMDEHDDQLIGSLGTRFELRLSMMSEPLYVAPATELRWLVSESDALRKFRSELKPENRLRLVEATKRWILRDMINGGTRALQDRWIDAPTRDLMAKFSQKDATQWQKGTWESFTLQLLWRACRHGVHGVAKHQVVIPAVQRHRDLLYAATGEDIDLVVNELLVKFCAAFLDQGLSQWSLPNHNQGFFQAFVALYATARMTSQAALADLPRELRCIRDGNMLPLESISQSLSLLGVHESEAEEFIAKTLLSLRGWTGMIHQMETRGDRVPRSAPPGTLVEFLAVRLVLERLTLAHIARNQLSFDQPLNELRKELRRRLGKHDEANVDGRAFSVFQIAQMRGWTPEFLLKLPKSNWEQLIQEIEAFSSVERRKVFQLALERTYRQQVLSAYSIHTRRFWLPRFAAPSPQKPKEILRRSFQIICCIDDREESFRRHLEEIDPSCETFGAAGFFSAAMYYRGATDAHFVPLCPIIMKPQHYVVEEVDEAQRDQYGRSVRVRRVLGKQVHGFHRISRTFWGGVGTAIVGSLATIPLVARVLFPRTTARFRRSVGKIVQPPLATRLTLARQSGSPSKEPSGLGFSMDEMINTVERLLRDIGLTDHFSRLVVVCGHGSSSLNNPHESAYNCGACGGGRGGPNARAIADMANHPEVRRGLEARGLAIPDDTYFLGAYHNTCNDLLVFFDRSALPISHQSDLNGLKQTLMQARERNAHERCRRFESAPLTLTPSLALRHVEARAEDLSQTRPEYNHATNAICTVGRRSRTRGLFLDRRSFLVSYDPRQDDDQCSILTRILQAVVPVCGGINLEYYFSRVDVPGYGCGTKLPHNVTSLIGVMDGAASDLRTGLSAQMTEIHDPIRLLFVIETSPTAFLTIMELNPVIKRLCGNGWVQVATLDPKSDEIHLLKVDRFERFVGQLQELPQVDGSIQWYRGWRGNLGFAHVIDGLSPTPTAR